MKKVLIFTDSRGQHKLTFKNKKIFTEKIGEYIQEKGINVDFQSIPEANHFFSNVENILTTSLNKYIKKEIALF